MASVNDKPISVSGLIESDRIHSRLYDDPEIFDREIEMIWNKVWVYVGHESEVKKPGDYVRRNIGTQPVIMMRGQDGKIRVFHNRCRHRGNLICHHNQGNTGVLRCPYHGWTYSTEGALIAPTFDEAYEEGLQSADFGLSELPRVDAYRGLVFASLSDSGVSLEEHLGAAKPFLDLVMDRSPVGEIELSAGITKTRYRGNWKMLPENSLEGGYHGFFIHKFAFDLADSRTGRDRMVFHDDAVWYLPGGHMVEDFRSVDLKQPDVEYRKTYAEMLEDRYGAKLAGDLLPGKAPIVFIFPNLMYVQTHIRHLQPVSVDQTVVYYQPAMLKGVPEEINRDILRQHEGSFGPAGFLAPDDIEILERTQAAIKARGNEWLFVGRGLHREHQLPDGTSVGHSMDENHIRGMWRHYAQVMNGQA
jgi:phenylpropionate dioxygenase-like ring-hydroxylating dioxygenase large terminal subunit